MKSFGTYISKHLASFAAFLLILVIVNVVLYGVTFYHTVSEDYGEASPHAMLELTSTAATTEGLPDYAEQKLRQYNIWAMYLTSTGECFWRLDVPQEVPQHYSIQEVALFSKGYLEDYPVFVWSTEDGLLVLGYPKNSYMKLTSNYYSMETIQKIPLYVIGMLGMDVLCLFLAYYFSKRRIIQNTEPIVDAIETLADGKPVSLHIDRELSEIANSVNKASLILSRQNEARANWISGVSHDIRTPLSMIMGYADRIAADKTASEAVEALKRDRIDAALVASGTCGDGILEQELFNDRFFAYVSPENPLYERQNIRIEDIDLKDLVILSAGNCMRDQIIELCQAKRDMPSHYSFESGSLDTLMRIVDCTSCLTIIPEMAIEYIPADHHDRLKMLAKGATSRKIAVAVRRTYVKSSIIKALTDTIMANIPEVKG